MQQDGATLRQHLQKVWQQTGIMPEQLKADPLPNELKYIWEWFVELSNGRQSSGLGLSPITFKDFNEFERRKRMRLAPWEEKAIRAIDTVWMSHQSKRKD